MDKDLIPDLPNMGIIAIDENLDILKYNEEAKELIPDISIGDNFLDYVENANELNKGLKDLISGEIESLNKSINLKNSKSAEIYAFCVKGIVFVQIRGTQPQKDEIKGHSNILKLIYDFVLNTAKLRRKEDFFMETYKNLKKLLKFNSFAISLVNKDKKSFTVVFSYEEGKRLPKRTYNLDPHGSLTGWVIYNKKMLYIKNVKKEKLPSKTHQVGHTISSWLGIPLIHRGEVLGALVICGFEPEAFNKNEVKLLKTMAAYISLILKNVLLYEEIKENRDMLENIINSSLIGIVINDLNENILFANKKFAELLCYSPQELIGKNIKLITTPKSFKEIKERTKRRLKGLSDLYETQLVRKDGKIIDVIVSASPLRDSSGKITSSIGIIGDISERKMWENEIRRRNKLLSSLYRISLKMGGFPEPREMFEIIYNELKNVFNFHWLAISFYDKEKDIISFQMIKSEEKEIENFTVKCDPATSITARVIKTKEPFLTGNILRDLSPDSYQIAGPPDVVDFSNVIVPIIYENEVLGTIGMAAKEKNAYDEYTVEYLRTLASSLGIFIANYNLYKEIKRTKETLENLINTTLVGIIIEDMNGKLSFVNDRFAKMLGYNVEDLVGKKIEDFATPESREIMLKKGKLRMLGISDSYEAQFVKNNGERVDVLINASPLKDENGKLLGIVGVISDITERKNLERKIREEWGKYKTLMENLLVGIVIVRDGKVIFANNVIADLLKYDRGEAIGENFLKFIHPDMRNHIWDLYQSRLRGLPTPSSYIVKFIDSQGNPVWTIIRSSVIDWEGERAVIVSIQDITRIKNMEEKLLALVKTFEKIKLSHSKDEIYELAINALASILNLKIIVIAEILGDKITAKKWKGIKHPKSIALHSENSIVTWVVKNNKSYYAPDVSKDPLYLKVNPETKSEYATPISSNHKLFGVLNVESDKIDGISDDDRMLIDLMASHIAVAIAGLKYHKDLEDAKNLQELMLHIVSHDLKNPLAVLHGYLELMNEECPNKHIPTMMKAVQEAEDIIEKARLFSRLGNKKIDMKKESIDLKEIIEDSVELIKQKYPHGKIILNVPSYLLQALPIIKEVFVNILDNAFKYGASKVTIVGKIFESYMEIRIADDGLGIPESKRDIIFKPFERLASGKGSGLGLAIVKMIMELHKGEVKIENNVPKGTVFILRFP